jgi:hypothetical protein
LEVWKQPIELAKAVYELTAGFPASEMYGVISQMRRSAVSIASNIAKVLPEIPIRNSCRSSYRLKKYDSGPD